MSKRLGLNVPEKPHPYQDEVSYWPDVISTTTGLPYHVVETVLDNMTGASAPRDNRLAAKLRRDARIARGKR